MAIQISSGAPASGAEPRRSESSPTSTSSPDALAPIIAGARARGIADAFEMIGEGAILLDFSGSVLHVGQLAGPMLGCALAVTGGHVVATRAGPPASCSSSSRQGLADNAPRVLEADLLCAEEGMRQRVRMVRAPSGDAYQLLASVLVLEPPRRVRCRRVRSPTRRGRKGGRVIVAIRSGAPRVAHAAAPFQARLTARASHWRRARPCPSAPPRPRRTCRTPRRRGSEPASRSASRHRGSSASAAPS